MGEGKLAAPHRVDQGERTDTPAARCTEGCHSKRNYMFKDRPWGKSGFPLAAEPSWTAWRSDQ